MPQTPFQSPKVIRSTPIKARATTSIPGKRQSVSNAQISSNAGITSSEYGEKHPVYPFFLNKKRRRPLLSREELMALYGTGNLLARYESRLHALQNGAVLSQENIEDLLSDWNSDEDEDVWDRSLSILKWSKENEFKIPSVELSMEAEIQYENGVSLFESEMFVEASACFQYVINEVEFDKDAWFYLARCYEGMRLRKVARDAYTTAARYGSMEALGILAVWERRSIQNKKTEEEEDEELSTDPEVMERYQQKRRRQELMKRFFKEKYEKQEAEKDDEKRKKLQEKLQAILREHKAHIPNAKEQSETMFTFGVQKQKSGNFEQAIVYYEQAASMGNANAFYNLACIYRDGLGLENSKPDHLTAMLLFQKAASKNHLKAKLNIGVQQQRGDSGEKNLWYAFYTFREASRGGLSEAQSHYNQLLAQIEKRCKSLVDAIDFSKLIMAGFSERSSSKNNPEVSGILGDIFSSQIASESTTNSGMRRGGAPSPRLHTGSSTTSLNDRNKLLTAPAKKSVVRELFRNESKSNMKSSADKNSSQTRNSENYRFPGKFATKFVDGAFLNRWEPKELQEEIKAQAAFISSANHNNIINIYSLHFETTKNQCFISMDRCLCSLRQYITSFDKFSGDSLQPAVRKQLQELQQSEKSTQNSAMLQILIQIAKGIQYLHSKKILHRKLNDISVLFIEGQSRSLDVKLTDFGGTTLANYFESKFDSNHKQGNLVYCAPEVLKGLHSQLPYIYTKASDIYSFGVLMHFIWSRGHLPFPQIRKESGYYPPDSKFYKSHPSHESEYCRIALEAQSHIFTNTAQYFTSNEAVYKLIEACCEWDPEKRLDSFDTIVSRLEEIKL